MTNFQTTEPQVGPLPQSGITILTAPPVMANRFAGYDNVSPTASNNPYPVADTAYGPLLVQLLSAQNELFAQLIAEMQALRLTVSQLNQPTVDEFTSDPATL